MTEPRRGLSIPVNLAREPFRSFKLYYAVWGVLALVGVASLAWESLTLVSLLGRRSAALETRARLQSQIERDGAAHKRLEPHVQKKALEAARDEVTEVRQLIERRRFDWNALFTELEKVLPNDVRLTDVAPRSLPDGVGLELSGVAKGLPSQNELVERLEASELFDDVFVRSQSASGNEVEFDLTCRYRGAGLPSLPRQGAAS